MWGESGNFGQGGFMDPGMMESPSADGGRKQPQRDRRGENVVPVTIEQILQSGENFRIGEVEVNVVSVVGIVREREVAPVKVTYLIDDGTGQIEALLWLDTPLEEEKPLLNMYCHVYGSVRENQGKKNIMVFKICPLEDLNELTCHILEVIDVHQNAPLLTSIESNAGASSSGGRDAGLSNSMMGLGNTLTAGMGTYPMDAAGGPSKKQKLVLDVIGEAAATTNEEGGVTVPFIAQKVKGLMDISEVRSTVDYLLQEGFIFSTIDDEHFTVTK